MAARRPNSHTPVPSLRSSSTLSSWGNPYAGDWSKENTLNATSLLGRVKELEMEITAFKQEKTLLQATIKALRADTEALKEENRIVTEVMREWEKTEQAQWSALQTRLEDSIHMLEDQLAAETESKQRLEQRVVELDRRNRGRDKGRELELEAEVTRLRRLVEDKDLENDRMVHKLHAFMQEAEDAKAELQSLKPPSRSISRSVSRKSSFHIERKSSRCSPIPFNRPASVSRLR